MPQDVLVLAADLGGSALKLGLVNAQGGLLAASAHPLADREAAPGRAEQDPETWWRAFCTQARALVRHREEQVVAIALTGATRCSVLVDADDAPLGPALMLRDRRAEPQARELTGHAEAAALGPIDASHPIARLLWFAQCAPELLARARWLLEPADFLALRLTGTVGLDPVRAARFAHPAVHALAARFGLPLELVPPSRPLASVLGGLGRRGARALGLREGVPVVVAPMDAWCATLATHALQPGRAYASAGSTLVAGLILDRPHTAPGLVCPPWGAGLWHLGGPSRTGGTALFWLARLLGRSVAELIAMLAREEVAQAAPLCLPWPEGERLPVHAPALRARFCDLGADVSPASLAFALLEGLAFWVRMVIEQAETATLVRAPMLRLTGGLALIPCFPRLLAEALARPVLCFPGREGALLGAAGLALRALGLVPDLDAAQAALEAAQAPRRIEPDATAIALRAERFARFRAELARTLAEAQL